MGCMFQNTLEGEPYTFLTDVVGTILLIGVSVQFYFQGRFVNSLLKHTFISCLVNV